MATPEKPHKGNTMSKIYSDNAQSIGNTPLIKLNHVIDGAKATVLAKIEGRNPAYSVKCRIGAAMINDAQEQGLLGQGREIIEPTSGNTGIALAFVAAARGIPLTLTMPETMSIERRKLLSVLGASCADSVRASVPDRWYWLGTSDHIESASSPDPFPRQMP